MSLLYNDKKRRQNYKTSGYEFIQSESIKIVNRLQVKKRLNTISQDDEGCLFEMSENKKLNLLFVHIYCLTMLWELEFILSN